MARNGRKTTLLQSFNYAFQGLVYAVRFQRNMRVHLIIGALVLITSVFLNLSRLEFTVVVFAVMFVLAMELLNSAVEKVVDIATSEIDPRAKAANGEGCGGGSSLGSCDQRAGRCLPGLGRPSLGHLARSADRHQALPDTPDYRCLRSGHGCCDRAQGFLA